MKRIGILVAAVLLLAGMAQAQTSSRTVSAIILPTSADTAGVLLQIPGDGRTVKVHGVTLWYDNAANTNPVYVGITTANAAATRVLWLGEAMTSAGIKAIAYPEVNLRVPAATAQAGLRLFVSAAASDTLSAVVEYEVIKDD